ncbi:hypothetical protein FBZ98_1011008 [Rhizobium sp. ERR 922]|uniref:hypothetical protein n=1 Tax=unclassified Rhizobium TaxID=2613769 RepID=UPI00119D53D0|nr:MULTISPECIES: hypothetical protein [unclassified Rhizobium]TWB61663.1 hypothetical protein FBZ98_1011008 [Rhizobium sp. ERR 922]TWC04589.1 hypothetical protein FBZ97_1011008 [Rhizobium sp. ERR 942]
MTADGQIIPGDIHDTAMHAVDGAREDFLLAKASDNQANLRKVAIACVEKAILAERERCAAAVEAMFDDDGFPLPNARRIASSIRKGGV